MVLSSSLADPARQLLERNCYISADVGPLSNRTFFAGQRASGALFVACTDREIDTISKVMVVLEIFTVALLTGVTKRVQLVIPQYVLGVRSAITEAGHDDKMPVGKVVAV